MGDNRDKLNQRLSMRNILICGLNGSWPQFNLKWNTNYLGRVRQAILLNKRIKRVGRIKKAGQAGRTLGKHLVLQTVITDQQCEADNQR